MGPHVDESDEFFGNEPAFERCPPLVRHRRRGPRSFAALARRQCRRRFTSLQLGAPGSSGAAPIPGAPSGTSTIILNSLRASETSHCNLNGDIVSHETEPTSCVVCANVRIWSINCRRLLRRRAELEARLWNAGVDILVLQETWLSTDVESVTISGFSLVGRLDRLLGPKCGFGGIAIFARSSLTNIALLEYEDGAERMWCALLTNLGTILLGNWYRPPDDDGSSLDGLAAAISRLQSDVIGILLVGDVNIHHQRWLHHSHSNTAVGERLWNICRDAGLKQLVKEPTRKQYLLDLVLSNIPELVKVTVLPEISDNRVVNIEVNAVVSISPAIERTVWMFRKADWDGLKADFSSTDWKLLFQDIDPEGSVHNFCNYIETCCIRRIPRRVISTRVCSHPWLDAECIAAVQAKCAAVWSDEFRTKELECERI